MAKGIIRDYISGISADIRRLHKLLKGKGHMNCLSNRKM